ncbi:MAG: hypothetical protein ACK5M3_15695 [Dysgonomonas sp.]
MLDLKENDNLDANSNRGLVLPRAMLDSLTITGGNTNLATTVRNASGVWDIQEHIGLALYNVNKSDACIGGADEGVYVWDGEKWLDLWSNKPIRPVLGSGTDQYQGANTYIVMKGQSVSVPVKRAFQIWNEYGGGTPDESTGHVLPNPTSYFTNYTTGILTVDIIWQEAFDATASDVLVSAPIAVNQLSPIEESTFTIVAGSKEGNALVALKIDGQVIWQWQIWVPSSDPTATAYGYNTGSSVYWFMDRYLGAVSTEKQKWDGAQNGNGGSSPALRNAHGLYYQWGRPTPFKKFGESTDFQNADPANVPLNFLTAISSHLFIRSTSGEGGNTPIGNTVTMDWYSNTPQYWGTRWGDGTTDDTGNKTAFDPCPVGWRIPAWKNNVSPWNCLANSDQKLDFATYGGYDFTELGRILGYYPASGYRARSTSYLYDIGNNVSIWAATPSAPGASNEGGRRLYFSAPNPPNTAIFPESNHRMANGLSVRCVQDN